MQIKGRVALVNGGNPALEEFPSNTRDVLPAKLTYFGLRCNQNCVGSPITLIEAWRSASDRVGWA